MLLLKGEKCKSIIVQSILDSKNDTVCYQYVTRKHIVNTLDSYIVLSEEMTQTDFGKNLYQDLLNKEKAGRNILIVYTNFNEEYLFNLKVWLNKIEHDLGYIIVLTCK